MKCRVPSENMLPHTQTNAGMCTRGVLFKSSESRTVLQWDSDGDRQSLLIYPRGNVKWLTQQPTYYPSQQGLRRFSRPRRSLPGGYMERKETKKERGRRKSSETKPKAHLSVGWGGLDRAEIKSLWEHCDHNLRNPQPLQLSLTGPETPTSHTPALPRMWT